MACKGWIAVIVGGPYHTRAISHVHAMQGCNASKRAVQLRYPAMFLVTLSCYFVTRLAQGSPPYAPEAYLPVHASSWASRSNMSMRRAQVQIGESLVNFDVEGPGSESRCLRHFSIYFFSGPVWVELRRRWRRRNQTTRWSRKIA